MSSRESARAELNAMKVSLGMKFPDRTPIVLAQCRGASKQAGLQSGDVLLSMKGIPVSNTKELVAASQRLVPGETIDCEIERDGEKMTLPLWIAAKDESDERVEELYAASGYGAAPEQEEAADHAAPAEEAVGQSSGAAVQEGGEDEEEEEREQAEQQLDENDPRVQAIKELSSHKPELGMSFNSFNQQGVRVTEVSEGMPCQRAGLKRDDVVVSMGGHPVNTKKDFVAAWRQCRVGDLVPLVVQRDGEQEELDLVVGGKGLSPGQVARLRQQADGPEPIVATEAMIADHRDRLAAQGPELGCNIKDHRQNAERSEPHDTVRVTKVHPGKAAEDAGLQEGDVIWMLNNSRTENRMSFISQFKQVKSGEELALILLRDNCKTQVNMVAGAKGVSMTDLHWMRRVAQSQPGDHLSFDNEAGAAPEEEEKAAEAPGTPERKQAPEQELLKSPVMKALQAEVEEERKEHQVLDMKDILRAGPPQPKEAKPEASPVMKAQQKQFLSGLAKMFQDGKAFTRYQSDRAAPSKCFVWYDDNGMRTVKANEDNCLLWSQGEAQGAVDGSLGFSAVEGIAFGKQTGDFAHSSAKGADAERCFSLVVRSEDGGVDEAATLNLEADGQDRDPWAYGLLGLMRQSRSPTRLYKAGDLEAALQLQREEEGEDVPAATTRSAPAAEKQGVQSGAPQGEDEDEEEEEEEEEKAAAEVPTHDEIRAARQQLEGAKGLLGMKIKDGQSEASGRRGVLVSLARPEGAAAAAGVESSDLILSWNDDEVLSRQDFFDRIPTLRPGKPVNFVIERKDEDEKLSVPVVPGGVGLSLDEAKEMYRVSQFPLPEDQPQEGQQAEPAAEKEPQQQQQQQQQPEEEEEEEEEEETAAKEQQAEEDAEPQPASAVDLQEQVARAEWEANNARAAAQAANAQARTAREAQEALAGMAPTVGLHFRNHYDEEKAVTGLEVTKVLPGSSAEHAELLPGEHIDSVHGGLMSKEDFVNMWKAGVNAGDVIPLKVKNKDNETRDVDMVIGSKSADMQEVVRLKNLADGTVLEPPTPEPAPFVYERPQQQQQEDEEEQEAAVQEEDEQAEPQAEAAGAGEGEEEPAEKDAMDEQQEEAHDEGQAQEEEEDVALRNVTRMMERGQGFTLRQGTQPPRSIDLKYRDGVDPALVWGEGIANKLPLRDVDGIVMGKQTRELERSEHPADSCFSVLSAYSTPVHLEAPDTQTRSAWVVGVRDLVKSKGGRELDLYREGTYTQPEQDKQPEELASPVAEERGQSSGAVYQEDEEDEEDEAESQAPAAAEQPKAAAAAAADEDEVPPVAVALPAAEAKAEPWKLEEKMAEGYVFLWYATVRNNTRKREVRVFYKPAPARTGDAGTLHWCLPGSRREIPHCQVALSSITAVERGKSSTALRSHVAKDAPEECCMAIISSEKQLNIEARSPEEAQQWLCGLQDLVTQHGLAIAVRD